ncbi:DUF58 domain-containing protein [Natrinema altunense]|uniref:DUF58 domain-containing protein n=1 Tax=Natrinema altunense (strain JCM 12890 / CGMCC 1.3731 / AJ2) TaxID=1227494 RepID=L9ZBT6_NATA2|nr:DUF58 domain-containing protein [Natrinema altunense]ELY83062.1 hypothetical protein C485_18839 [Natrinema altunense JCM 12890]
MRLTRRGWTVVAVVLAAVVLSWRFGPRALNAVVVPLVVALLAGVVTVGRTDRPHVVRRPVAEGFIGEQRTVEVTIEADGTAAATVRDVVGNGLSATTAPRADTTLAGEETISYDVRLEARGEHRIGPLSIAVSDMVGLVERRFEYEETTPVVVYPRVRDLGGGPAVDIRTLASVADRHVDEEFDHLREYHRGDPLRDVHWKTAAKQPDDELVVAEYATDGDAGTVTVAAECLTGNDDEMASAAATVATFLLEQGATVAVTVPDGTRPPGSGNAHHRDILQLLAVAEPGELADRTRRDADVLVRTDGDGTTVVVDDREIPFARLRGRDRADGGRRNNRHRTANDGRRDRETDGQPGVTA